MKDLAKKWWFKWLVIGVAIRLVLMSITLHPDLWGHSFVAYFFAYEGVFNPYEHLLTLGQDHPLVTNFGVGDIFIYPPLTYFTLGIFRLLVKPLVDPNFIPWLWSNVGEGHTYQNIGFILFWFKLPYLFIDLATAFLFTGLFDKERNKKLAFLLWMFNPVTLYATFMMGQFDIIPVALTILSTYFYKKEKYEFASLSLGFGAAYKMYPILLLPAIVLLSKSKLIDRVKLFIIGLVPFAISIAPFLGSPAFRQMVLFSPKSSKMLFMSWKLTAAEGLYPFILILIFIYWLVYFTKVKLNVNTIFLTILLLIFSVSHYHPQWFLWVSPFLIWAYLKDKTNWILVSTIFACWLFIMFTFEPSLNLGLFHIIDPSLKEVSGLTEILSARTDITQLNSLVRSIFAGTSAYLVYKLKNA